ncbi:hypothetical protein B5X24_HaOG217275 [Helicoverpa armigera]|uniref:Uncharacterized protein n=1 Tax=Helicoverpa armigera TaxID=29058 RepID=A0A2W1BYI5_HELAM|nr:hypothetical protein B5X24_HaOG217275 [Helicoverpa armigera]
MYSTRVNAAPLRGSRRHQSSMNTASRAASKSGSHNQRQVSTATGNEVALRHTSTSLPVRRTRHYPPYLRLQR